MEQGVDYSCQTTGPGGASRCRRAPPGGQERRDRLEGAVRRVRARGQRLERRGAHGRVAEFARKVREHIVQELGRKGYWAQSRRHRTSRSCSSRRRLPRRGRGAGCGARRLRVRTRSAHPPPRTIGVMLRTIRVAWQERTRRSTPRPSSRSRRSCTSGSARWRTTWRRSAAGWTRPSAHTTRRSARTDRAVLVVGPRLEGLAATALAARRPRAARGRARLVAAPAPGQLEVVPKDADAA